MDGVAKQLGALVFLSGPGRNTGVVYFLLIEMGFNRKMMKKIQID